LAQLLGASKINCERNPAELIACNASLQGRSTRGFEKSNTSIAKGQRHGELSSLFS
jgi:hypothetical protein